MEQNLPNELAARVKFSEVVKRFEKISTTSDLKQKAEILGKFYKSIFKLQERFRDEEGPEAKASFYPFLRLFVPYRDSERGSLGIQTTTLGRLFVKALAINPKSETGLKLTNLQGNTADYGDIVYNVMKTRSPEEGTLTVYEVNKYLDLIADHFENNERSKIDEEIVHMLNGMSAMDRKWLTRIILKKLRLGLGNKKMLDLYNTRANELYNQCGHLSDVCNAIESNMLPENEPSNGLIQIFRPIRSMLCERGYISQINRMLSEHDYYLETKMDGERCQVHINGTQFKYFSRGGKDDLTTIFGSSDRSGLFSPFFYRQINKVQNAIFDGEMMVWDREEETFLKKSENFTAKYLKESDPKLIPCFVIYDLIFYNGASLIDKPYAERIRLMGTLIKEQRGALMLCYRIKLRDANHFLECLNKAFDANEEGVVIKQADSKYRPGQREKGGWFKMKPDYENNLISDFDLLIIGGYYNDNQTGIDSFLLGVMKKPEKENEQNVFYAVCKIRNGFKRSQFREICQRLLPFQHKTNTTKIRHSYTYECPPGIEWNNANPDFWYDPQQSIVLQIKASELVETTKYRTSHSFRFPRVMEVRWDKLWYDTCTLNEFQTFCSSNSKVEKLTKRHATADDLTNQPLPKRARHGPAPKAMPSVSAPPAEIQPIDDICKGKDICIINGEKNSHSVEEMENMVRRHGGRVVKYPNPSTFVVIAGNPNVFQVKNFIKSKKYNIAKPDWLVRALGKNKPLTELIKLKRSDMIFATESLENQFNADSEIYDEFDYDTPPMDFEGLTDANEQPMDGQSNANNQAGENENDADNSKDNP